MTQKTPLPKPKKFAPNFLLPRIPNPSPQPRFREWIDLYGVSAIGKRIGVARLTVQSWKAKGSYGRMPNIPMAFTCIALSAFDAPCADGKPLALEDIYGDPVALMIKQGPAEVRAC